MEKLVKSSVDRIYIALDNDAKKDALKHAEKLMSYGKEVYMVELEGKDANEIGIAAIVKQQFEFAKVILAGGLVPIIEPEVDIKSPNKAACEEILKREILKALETINQRVIFKLTIPSVDNFYEELTKHPKVIRVVALSGGYSRAEANALLAKQRGLIASFSRALTEGLSIKQNEAEFDQVLDWSIQSIFEASTNKMA